MNREGCLLIPFPTSAHDYVALLETGPQTKYRSSDIVNPLKSNNVF